MAKLYVLIGRIGCGKTTYAHKLCEQETTVLLSHDELMLQVNTNCIGREAHVKQAMSITEYFMNLSKQLVSKGISVVLDYGFWTRKEREQVRCLAKELGVDYEIIYISIPEELRKHYVEKRNKKIKSDEKAYVMDKEKLERLDAFFEEPQEDEYDLLLNENFSKNEN